VSVELDTSQRREFERLVEPLLDPLYRTACWLLRDAERAQDLLQESLVKALRGFGGFEPGTSFRAWVFRIMRNTFIDGYRSREREPDFLSLDDLDEIIHPSSVVWERAMAATPEKVILDRLMMADLRRALEALPEKYRTPVILRDLEGISYKEISLMLGIPVGTVMTHIYRGRRLLQKEVLGLEAGSQENPPHPPLVKGGEGGFGNREAE
jgi:RNA polymerase sigma-70 factor (ECF subfamily)